MKPGQILQVSAPDGSRTVMATIPQGMAPGQSFLVSFPLDKFSGNIDQGSDDAAISQGSSQRPISTPVTASIAPAQPQTPIDLTSFPFSQALDNPPQTSAAPKTSPSNDITSGDSNDQKLLLVAVPAGTAAGATLYVQVPGENRTLKATVPPGVTQFHVAYQPRTAVTSQAIVPISAPSVPTPIPVNPVPSTHHESGQRLILVRVPYGTTPGSTLHVEVPDEPGRILSAQVPPNVAEFQLAYVPRTITSQQQHASQNHNDASRPRESDSGDRMMGNSMIPFVGAAAMGAAASIAMYDHYNH